MVCIAFPSGLERCKRTINECLHSTFKTLFLDGRREGSRENVEERLRQARERQEEERMRRIQDLKMTNQQVSEMSVEAIYSVG